jgi:hypothetical protein
VVGARLESFVAGAAHYGDDNDNEYRSKSWCKVSR